MAHKKRTIKSLFGKEGSNISDVNSKQLELKKYDFVKYTDNKFSDSTIYDVPLKDIDLKDKKFQMRQSTTNLEELEISIKSDGQDNPIFLLYRKADLPKLIVISGFSRANVIDKLGQTTIKAIIKTDMSDSEAMLLGMRDNEVRNMLSDWDRVAGIIMLREKGVTDLEIAKGLGKDRSTITGYAALNNACETIKTALKNRKLDITKAQKIMKYQDKLDEKTISVIINKSQDISRAMLEDILAEMLKNIKPAEQVIDDRIKKPKNNSSRSPFSVNIGFVKKGDEYRFSGKLRINKENALTVIEQLENIIKELKEFK